MNWDEQQSLTAQLAAYTLTMPAQWLLNWDVYRDEAYNESTDANNARPMAYELGLIR